MDRPFFDASAAAIRAAGRAAYERGDISLLCAAISELSQFRTTGEARRIIEELAPLLEKLKTRTSRLSPNDNLPQPPKDWLAGVQAVAGGFAGGTSTGSCSVYLILLRTLQPPYEFGVYVGETSHTAEERFRNHKRGYKSSLHVRNHGVALLRPFFDHLQGISRENAQHIERGLAASLTDAGYWVEGGH